MVPSVKRGTGIAGTGGMRRGGARTEFKKRAKPPGSNVEGGWGRTGSHFFRSSKCKSRSPSRVLSGTC